MTTDLPVQSRTICSEQKHFRNVKHINKSLVGIDVMKLCSLCIRCFQPGKFFKSSLVFFVRLEPIRVVLHMVDFLSHLKILNCPKYCDTLAYFCHSLYEEEKKFYNIDVTRPPSFVENN